MIQHTNSLLIGQAPAEEEQHILGDLLWPLDTEWVQTELNFSLNVHDILSDWFLLRAPWKYQNDRTASFYCSSPSSSSSSCSSSSTPMSSSGLLCVGFLSTTGVCGCTCVFCVFIWGLAGVISLLSSLESWLDDCAEEWGLRWQVARGPEHEEVAEWL